MMRRRCCICRWISIAFTHLYICWLLPLIWLSPDYPAVSPLLDAPFPSASLSSTFLRFPRGSSSWGSIKVYEKLQLQKALLCNLYSYKYIKDVKLYIPSSSSISSSSSSSLASSSSKSSSSSSPRLSL